MFCPLLGSIRRIHLRSSLQDLQRQAVAALHHPYRHPLPRLRVRRVLHSGHRRVVVRLHWCCALPQHARSADPLVRYLCAIGVLGRLLWIQEGSHRIPCCHFEHSSINPHSALVSIYIHASIHPYMHPYMHTYSNEIILNII